MSRLAETRSAYDKLVELLDAEVRKRSGSTKDLERFQATLDVAFYLLGWAQFEYLVRQETDDLIDGQARAHTIDSHAWRYLKENLKNVPVRRRLDLIFHTQPGVRARLDRDNSLRTEAAHNNQLLPREAQDISAWLQNLEDLVGRF
jgi:hypothetical protein